MDSENKITIRPRGAASLRVQVREKLTYNCASCHNQYYDHHLFCPQCLGHVLPSQARPSQLRITALPEEKTIELGVLLAALTGKKTFAFQKALESLPWLMIQNTEECILRHWKEVLEAEKSEAEIEAWQPVAKKSWRGKSSVFAANAPPPRFLSEAADNGVRHVAQSLKDPRLRLKWVEAVFSGVSIVEDFYKRHPSYRLLFSDFLFNIDHDLAEAVKDYDSMYKTRESEMEMRIGALQSRFGDMAREIEEVKQRVEERL